MTYAGKRAIVNYEMPLERDNLDFYDWLNPSARVMPFDYSISGFDEGDLVKLAIIVNQEAVDAFSMIVQREMRGHAGRMLSEKLQGLIPPGYIQDPHTGGQRQQDDREGKDSGAAQGRDCEMLRRRITRKRKLLEKQKEGKKKMRQFGRVEIPPEAFVAR